MIRKSFIIVTLLLLSMAPFAETEDSYVPSPVIFVHGFGPGNWESWSAARNALKDYFVKSNGELKYDYINLEKVTIPYFPFPYLEYPGNSGIDEISRSYPLPVISQALSVLPDCPSTEKKVILVTHSMGGLVVKDFLKDNPQYAQNIKKVIFVGTPHRGSPLADFVYMLNHVKHNELLTQIKEEKSKSFNFGIKYAPGVKDNSSNENDYMAHTDLINKMEDYARKLNATILLLKVGQIDPDGKAIEHLMLSQNDVSFQRLFQGEYKGAVVGPVYLPKTPYTQSGNNTFLATRNLPMPSSYKIPTLVVTSQKSQEETDAEKAIKWLSEGFKDGFTFPIQESLDSIKTSGDGIVSLTSQSNGQGISPTLSVFHSDEPVAFANQILNAIDDSPVIEKMYVVSADRDANGPTYPVYVVIKVKDYLLADVEITSMTVDGTPIDLSEFDDGGGHYKPYVKFGTDKAFLMERLDYNLLDKDGSVITLYPGEFYVRLLDLEGNNPHVVNIELKNPSANPPTQKTLTIQRLAIIDETPTGTIEELRPTIQANITSPLGVDIDLNSLEMKLNGTPVSYTVSRVGPDITISYIPTSDLVDEQYIVEINGRDISGLPAEKKEWNFIIQTEWPRIVNETPTGHITQTRPATSARIYSPIGTNINLSSIIMKLDEITIPRSVSGGGSDITASYTPSYNLAYGTHTVYMYGEDINGLSASKTWTFNIIGEFIQSTAQSIRAHQQPFVGAYVETFNGVPGWSDWTRGLIRWNLQSVQPGFTKAIVEIYSFADHGSPISDHLFTVTIHEVIGNWYYDLTPFDPTILDSEVITNSGRYAEWDITSLAQSWINGSKQNYGILLKLLDESGEEDIYRRGYHCVNYLNYKARLKFIYE